MDSSSLLQNLTTLGHSLPALIAGGIALTLTLSRSSSAAGRKFAITGAAMMLAVAVLRLIITFAQTGLYESDAFHNAIDHNTFFALIGAAHFILSVIEATGLVMLVWAYCKAVPEKHAATKPR